MGEKCVEYLFGVRSIVPFRILWILAVPLGAEANLFFYLVGSRYSECVDGIT